MKKPIFRGLAALPLLLFLVTSCTNDIIESKNDKENKIVFNAAVGKQTLTRATEFSYWANGGTFPVRVHQTNAPSTTPIHNWTLTYNSAGPSWSYGPLVNQPGYSLTYYAYYPTSNVSAVSTTGLAGTFAYAVQATAATQEDLIAATASTISENVTLQFNHILSQINFAIQGIEHVKIEVTNIKVNGVKGAGTYTYDLTNATLGSWGTYTGGAVNYAYAPHAAGLMPTSGTDNKILYLGNTGKIGVANGENNTRNNALMLLPQTFVAATGGNFTFDFVIKDLSDVTLFSDTDVVVYFGDLTPSTWTLGKRYLYLIDFSDYVLGGPIVFTVNVNNWEDFDNAGGEIPVVVQ